MESLVSWIARDSHMSAWSKEGASGDDLFFMRESSERIQREARERERERERERRTGEGQDWIHKVKRDKARGNLVFSGDIK